MTVTVRLMATIPPGMRVIATVPSTVRVTAMVTVPVAGTATHPQQGFVDTPLFVRKSVAAIRWLLSPACVAALLCTMYYVLYTIVYYIIL